MRRLHHLSLQTLTILAIASLGASISQAATLSPYGDALPEPVVSMNIPDTRGENPYAATAKDLYRFNENAPHWEKLYTVPNPKVRILKIAGYPRSSKVIYLVHSDGVARSGDGGESWVESRPMGFPEGGEGVFDLIVNPIERQHAVLLTDVAAWETIDYGTTWSQLFSTSKEDPLIAGGFLSQTFSDNTDLILATRSGCIQFKGKPLLLQAAWTAPDPVTAMLVHPKDSVVALQFAPGEWVRFEAPSTGALTTTDRVQLDTADTVAFNQIGTSTLWLANDKALSLVSLQPGSASETITELPGTCPQLIPHPRVPDSLYLYSGAQVYRLNEAFSSVSPDLIESTDTLADTASHSWTLEEGSKLASNVENSGADLEAQLDAIIAQQPSFQRALQQVLIFSRSDPTRFKKWDQQARKRHWLPKLRVLGGVTERNTDSHTLYTPVDNFGFPGDTKSLSLSDDKRTFANGYLMLEWDLSEIVFDDEQRRIDSERRDDVEHRRELVEDLSELYYTRIQKIAEKQGLFGKPSSEQNLRLYLEIKNLTETLNGYCGMDFFKDS